MPGGNRGRRSKKNLAVALEIGEYFDPLDNLKSWWTDHDGMAEVGARKAERDNNPCHLYLDFGDAGEVVCVTVQRVRRM